MEEYATADYPEKETFVHPEIGVTESYMKVRAMTGARENTGDEYCWGTAWTFLRVS